LHVILEKHNAQFKDYKVTQGTKYLGGKKARRERIAKPRTFNGICTALGNWRDAQKMIDETVNEVGARRKPSKKGLRAKRGAIAKMGRSKEEKSKFYVSESEEEVEEYEAEESDSGCALSYSSASEFEILDSDDKEEGGVPVQTNGQATIEAESASDAKSGGEAKSGEEPKSGGDTKSEGESKAAEQDDENDEESKDNTKVHSGSESESDSSSSSDADSESESSSDDKRPKKKIKLEVSFPLQPAAC
jgi:hypothetical protein